MRIHVLAVLALSLAACGDDDAGGGGGKKGPQTEADKKAAADKKKADQAAEKAKKDKERKMEVISFIPTLEKVVPPDEAPTIRRRLKDRDFEPDPSGTDNRDPWHSYTLPQIVEATPQPVNTGVKPTDLCPKNKLVASNYAIKDLALLGIVTRGLQHYALLRDSTGVGHVVERGKCIGREKGLVTEIGDGFVSGMITPETLPNGTTPTAVKFTIPLYSTELSATPTESDDTDNSGGATAPVPPPTMAPVAPPPPPPSTTTPSPPPEQPPAGNTM